MRVLIVDKGLTPETELWALLVAAGFEVRSAPTAGQALTVLRGERCDFVLASPVDLLQNNLIQEIKHLAPLAQVVALAPKPSLLEMMAGLTQGLADYFSAEAAAYPQLIQALTAAGQKIRRWRAAFGTI